ncbi:hypothetical protein pEaSNUABM44_00554 [Erwinia phage pEa_SNUABM_44]|nr:hypothetical protein pEaSNUABM44_00554 [Erwinia phage pEa_SNUABM_44]
MLAFKSDKTSLLDLSVEEIRRLAWRHMDFSDFEDEINDKKFLIRMRLADKNMFSYILTRDEVCFLNKETIGFMLESLGSDFTEEVNANMFRDNAQYPIEFLERYNRNIPMYHVEHQKCITPEFLSKYKNRMDLSNFWSRFSRNHDVSTYAVWANYNDGEFRSDMEEYCVTRYYTAAQLASCGMTAPEYYNNIMNEQRVMSGDPCSDGQRSYAIWLRKYRRTFKDETGYPTWDQLLQLFEQHPRMNNNGYIDWLFDRAVRHDDEYISEYRETLEIGEVSERAYANETGETPDGEAVDVEEGCQCDSCVADRERARQRHSQEAPIDLSEAVTVAMSPMTSEVRQPTES